LRSFAEYVKKQQKSGQETHLTCKWDTILRAINVPSGKQLLSAIGILKYAALKDAPPPLKYEQINQALSLSKSKSDVYRQRAG